MGGGENLGGVGVEGAVVDVLWERKMLVGGESGLLCGDGGESGEWIVGTPRGGVCVGLIGMIVVWKFQN
jgi:hypothetical protein